jgi:hypothetical protein
MLQKRRVDSGRSLAMVREGIYGIHQVDPDGLHRQKRKAIAIIRGIGVHE